MAQSEHASKKGLNPDLAVGGAGGTSGVRQSVEQAAPRATSRLHQVVEQEADEELRTILLEYLHKPTPLGTPIASVEAARQFAAERQRAEGEEPPSSRRFDGSEWLEDEMPTHVSNGGVAPPPRSEPPAKRDRGVLIRVDGPTAGQVVSVSGSELIAGRSARAAMHLSDTGVSRKHARVFEEEGLFFVEDLGSSNGTFVSERAVTRTQLKDGDLVRFGPRATFRYSLMDEQHESVLRRLYESSIYDPLTEIFNRRHFEEQLEGEVAYAKRHGSPLSVILFDIDYFKRVNDGFGHPAGDQVLKEVCRVAQSQLRAEDLMARYGGEEFAVLLRAIPLQGAARAAERMRMAVADHLVDVGGMKMGVTISAGCATAACLPDPTPKGLVELADQRLYAAKKGGRNRVIFEDLPLKRRSKD